jgi:hypothetical protein
MNHMTQPAPLPSWMCPERIKVIPQFTFGCSVQGEPVHLFHLLFERSDGIQKTAVAVDIQGSQQPAGVSES